MIDPIANFEILRKKILQNVSADPKPYDEALSCIDKLIENPCLSYVSRYWKLMLEILEMRDDQMKTTGGTKSSFVSQCHILFVMLR